MKRLLIAVAVIVSIPLLLNTALAKWEWNPDKNKHEEWTLKQEKSVDELDARAKALRKVLQFNDEERRQTDEFFSHEIGTIHLPFDDALQQEIDRIDGLLGN